MLNENGTWGVWRLKGLINRAKGLINWLLLPVVAFYATRLVRKYSASAIVSVASGTYFLIAGIAARWMNIPLVLIVHDDWVPIVRLVVPGPQWLFHRMFRGAIRRADHVFVVSVGMREWLKAEYNVDSEVQMPATDPWEITPPATRSTPFRILYTGNGWAARDSLMFLIRLIREKKLRCCGNQPFELHLCTPWKVEEDPNIKQHGWVSELAVREHVAAADILFLPYSFASEDQVFTRTSFPAKAADYLASGKPILILGPKESTTSRYADELHCAEVVSELSEEALVLAICRLALDEDYRRNLVSNARRAFDLNHNILRQRERFFRVLGSLVNKALDHVGT